MVRKQENSHHFLGIYIPEGTAHSLRWGRFTRMLLPCVLGNPTAKSGQGCFQASPRILRGPACWGCQTQHHKRGGLHQQTRILSQLCGPESEIKVLASLVPVEALRERLFQASPPVSAFLVAAGNPWHSVVGRRITPTSAFVITWHSSSVCV